MFPLSVQLLLVLVLSSACYSQDFVISTSCTDSGSCLTLTQFAKNSSLLHSSRKLSLESGQHTLSTDFMIENVVNFSMLAADTSRLVTINCEQNAAFKFESVSELTIENIKFVSCGGDSLSPTPGISLFNVSGLHLVNVTLTGSTTGALHIADSHDDVILHGLSVVDNRNSSNTLILIENSTISLTGVTNISNNSILKESASNDQSAVVLRIQHSAVAFEDLLVSDNTSPNGVVNMQNSDANSSGNWNFKRNQVCMGGALTLKSTTLTKSGNLSFTNNSLISFCAISLYVTYRDVDDACNEDFKVIPFLNNQGSITSTVLVNSSLMLFGSLSIAGDTNGSRAAILRSRSSLCIRGVLDVRNNLVTYSAIRVDGESSLNVEGNSSFVGNTISNAMVAFSGNIMLSGRVNFTRNAGIIYASQSFVYINATSMFDDNSFSDDYSDGALGVAESSLVLSGDYTFKNNRALNKDGGAIFASIDCIVNFSGNGLFFNNSARYGGAIYLDQMSSINFEQGTSIHFCQNKAIKGAAIFIQASFSHVECSSDTLPCLFKFPEESAQESDISLYFTGNRGNPGASVLHANIEKVDFKIENQRFKAVDDLAQTFIISSNNSDPYTYSDTFLFCFCTNGSENICDSVKIKSKTVTKGKQFSFTVRTLKFFGDHKDEPVRSNLNSALDSEDNSSLVLPSLDGCFQVVHHEKCAELTFTVISANQTDIIELKVGESLLDTNKTLSMKIIFEECPLGFVYNARDDECVCDPRIKDSLVVCDLNDGKFQKNIASQKFWMGSYQNLSSVIHFKNCPVGYCITNGTFSLSNDSICDSYRAGLLCGECIEGFSLLLGGVKCGDCSEKNSYLALLIAFAALGVILVAVIFLTQITVAMGTINGLILYMNIVDVNQNIFLPPDFFRGYTIFISWLNLDFGIVTCFYNGMDQLQYAAWQFAFPLYLWFLVGGIVIACRYSVRISKLFRKSDPVAVLATIILLTYNSLVQNIINIFSFAQLVPPDNSTLVLNVWRYNGNISYAAGSHLALMIVALAFLVFLFSPYTLVLTTAQLLQKFEFTSRILRRFRLDPFLHAYQVPFKPAHRYWVGLCLMMRALLLVMFTIDKSETTVVSAIICFCFLSISMLAITGGVYSQHWHNVLEISFILNLGVLSVATVYFSEDNIARSVIAYISVTIAFVTFIGIVVFHIYKRLKKQPKLDQAVDKMKSKLKPTKPKKKKVVTSVIEVQNTSESIRVDLREPLLESQLSTAN